MRLASTVLFALLANSNSDSTSDKASAKIDLSCDDVSIIAGLSAPHAVVVTIQLRPAAGNRMAALTRGEAKQRIDLTFELIPVPKEPTAYHEYGSNRPGMVVVQAPAPALLKRLRKCGADARNTIHDSIEQCDQGAVEACSWLAQAYESGYGVQADMKRQVTFLRKACDGRHTTSCVQLGVLSYSGTGIERNEERAVKLWKEACERGEEEGCFWWATLGISDNSGRALPLLEQSCTRGYARSCSELGMCYLNGFGTLEDLGRAEDALRKACYGGFEQGCAELMQVKRQRGTR